MASRKSARAKKPKKESEPEDEERDQKKEPKAKEDQKKESKEKEAAIDFNSKIIYLTEVTRKYTDAAAEWTEEMKNLRQEVKALREKCAALQKEREVDHKKIVDLEKQVHDGRKGRMLEVETFTGLYHILEKSLVNMSGSSPLKNVSKKQEILTKPSSQLTESKRREISKLKNQEQGSMSNAESDVRKKNLVLFNVSEEILPEEVFAAIGVPLDDCKIQKFYRIKPQEKSAKNPRILVVTFEKQESVSQVMARKRMLKNSIESKYQRIFITKDRSPLVRSKEKLEYQKSKQFVGNSNSKGIVEDTANIIPVISAPGNRAMTIRDGTMFGVQDRSG
jgi:hypothetical protein